MLSNDLVEKKHLLLNAVLTLLFLFLLFGGLYFAKSFLIPLSFAAVLAMLLSPLSAKMEKKMHRVLAIIICLLLVLIVLGTVATLLAIQIANFAEDLPAIQKIVAERLNQAKKYFENNSPYSAAQAIAAIEEQSANIASTIGKYLKSFFLGTLGALATTSLVLVLTFFFMYYREKFEAFAIQYAPTNFGEETRNAIKKITAVTQQYLSGLVTVIAILAVVNSIGFTIIGLKYAIFFGIIAALLDVIPYIGPILGGFLPVSMAVISSDSWTMPLSVIGVVLFVQFLENYVLTPGITGSKVNLNPLATIIVIILGGTLWGVAGMILFIPFLGMAKVIFDHIKPLQSFSLLIGDSNDKTKPTLFEKVKKWFEKHEKNQQDNCEL